MVTWPDEHAAISWVIAKEPSYPLFRLMLCFDIPWGNDRPGNVLCREVYEGAVFAGFRVVISAVVDGLARYECLAYAKSCKQDKKRCGGRMFAVTPNKKNDKPESRFSIS